MRAEKFTSRIDILDTGMRMHVIPVPPEVADRLRKSKRVIINIGSVGQPRDGDNRLSYVLFDGTAVTFVRLAYDIDGAANAIRAVNELPDYLADRLSAGR